MRSILALCAVAFMSWSLPTTLAHTYFDSIIINGVGHTDCMRPSRQYEKENPISTVSSPDMTCGFLPTGATPSRTKCPVAAGSTISMQWWHTQPGDDVVASTHKGPCMVYLAKSETGAGPVWFKIYENGLDIATQTWCVDTLIQNRGRLDFVLPANLTAGNYLLRGEVIALHNGGTIDGSQPYVGCAEVTITGNGQSSPPTSSLVALPGAYRNTDPGLYPVSLYNGPLSSYIIPGPPVWGKGSAPVTPVTSGSTPSSSSSGGGGGGSNTPTIPSLSSSATCGAVTISTKLRAGASWGNPPHNIYDITVVNNGASDIRDLVIKITLNAGATNLDEVWNMVKTTAGNYWFTEAVKAGKTYTGAGYVIAGGDAKVQIVCASSSNTDSYSYASSSASSATTGSAPVNPATTGTAPTPATTGSAPVNPATTTGSAPVNPATTGSAPSPATTGSVVPSSTGTAPNDGSCRAGISFTLSNSWNNGGMVGIVISNTGSKPIKSIQVKVNIDANSWNLLPSSTPRVYGIPEWSLPLAAGARFDAAGYTFAGTQPTPGSVVSISC